MLNKFILMLCLLLLFPSMSYAGGNSFNIKIHKIETLEPYKHIIHFKKLDKIGDIYSHYPLDNCQDITLTVNYKYQERFYKKVILFLDVLFNPNNHQENINALNDEINFLKQNINKTLITNDIEAFNHNTNDICQLYSKTLNINKDNPIHGLSVQFFVR